jgi:hypothetical protein
VAGCGSVVEEYDPSLGDALNQVTAGIRICILIHIGITKRKKKKLFSRDKKKKSYQDDTQKYI